MARAVASVRRRLSVLTKDIFRRINCNSEAESGNAMDGRTHLSRPISLKYPWVSLVLCQPRDCLCALRGGYLLASSSLRPIIQPFSQSEKQSISHKWCENRRSTARQMNSAIHLLILNDGDENINERGKNQFESFRLGEKNPKWNEIIRYNIRNIYWRRQ